MRQEKKEKHKTRTHCATSENSFLARENKEDFYQIQDNWIYFRVHNLNDTVGTATHIHILVASECARISDTSLYVTRGLFSLIFFFSVCSLYIF